MRPPASPLLSPKSPRTRRGSSAPVAGRRGSRAMALALAAVAAACATATAPPPPPPKPIPLQTLATSMQAEIDLMQRIFDLRLRAGKLLAQQNAKLQKRGFSRRVPANPTLPALESNLRTHAEALKLAVSGWEAKIRPPSALPKSRTLQVAEIWQAQTEEIHGVIDARITLSGDMKAIVQYVDLLPKHVERAVVVTGHTPLTGGVRLILEAFYERQPPAPKVQLRWPALEDRLEAAGWKADDPKLKTDPAWPTLEKLDKLGRARTPDVRSVMAVANDFPRWSARAALFNSLAERISKVRGVGVLRSTPVPPDAPFPPVPAKAAEAGVKPGAKAAPSAPPQGTPAATK